MTENILKKRKYIFLLMPALFVALLWLVFGVEQLFHLDFTRFAIEPRTNTGLIGILFFPLLHGSLEHLAGNSTSLFVLLVAVRYIFPQLYSRVFWLAYFVPGMITWAIGRPAFHLGASGMIYALVAFVFISGVIRVNRYLLALSLLVVFLYGGMFWGMFPIEQGISWEGHIGGAFTGFAIALWYRKELPIAEVVEREPDWGDDDDEPDFDDWKEDELPTFENDNTHDNHVKITYYFKPTSDEKKSDL